jgi:hypothetical protein
MCKHVTAESPVDQIFGTPDRNTSACREEIVGVAILDDARIVNLADVTLLPWQRECGDETQR